MYRLAPTKKSSSKPTSGESNSLSLYSPLRRFFLSQLLRSLDNAYAICGANKDDIKLLLHALGVVRSLLKVQVGADEESLLKTAIW